MKRLTIIPLMLALTSCASHLSKMQCETISWKAEGYQDAANGELPRDLNSAVADCAKFNVTVNTKQYMQGWRQGAHEYCTPSRETGFLDGQAGNSLNAINYRMPICNRAGIGLNLSEYTSGRLKGLVRYCTYENGANLARQGKPLPNVCPDNLKKTFRQGWMSGKKEYCNQTGNAFALGKSGASYPAICPANAYVGFKSEYDRGRLIATQIHTAENRIAEIDRYVRWKSVDYGFQRSVDGYYTLGRNNSPQANTTLSEVNNLVSERKNIERDIFNLKVLH